MMTQTAVPGSGLDDEPKDKPSRQMTKIGREQSVIRRVVEALESLESPDAMRRVMAYVSSYVATAESDGKALESGDISF